MYLDKRKKADGRGDMPDILTQIAQRDVTLTESESADKKLRAVAKGSRLVRRLTSREHAAFLMCNAWQNGYLMVGTAQVVVQKRDDGTVIAFKL